MQSGQVGLSEAMLGDQSVKGAVENILGFLSRYLGSQAAALFEGEAGEFTRVATLGVPGDATSPPASA